MISFSGKKLVKFLLKNEDFIKANAIKNCHALGLHSFLLDNESKARLFIADETCVLRGFYDYQKPIVPVHSHKYDDYFVPLFKNSLVHHIYEVSKEHIDGFLYTSMNMFNYERLDGQVPYRLLGSEIVRYVGGFDRRFLKGSELHSVSIPTTEKSAWLVIKADKYDDFTQIGYGEVGSTEGLYLPFENPIEYIKEYLEL